MTPNFEMIGYLSVALIVLSLVCVVYSKSTVRFLTIYTAIGFLVTLQMNEHQARCGLSMPTDRAMFWRLPVLSVTWPAVAAVLLAGGDDCRRPSFSKTKERSV